jgi:hypothetical protein
MALVPDDLSQRTNCRSNAPREQRLPSSVGATANETVFEKRRTVGMWIAPFFCFNTNRGAVDTAHLFLSLSKYERRSRCKSEI